jgi:hypothetical protein
VSANLVGGKKLAGYRRGTSGTFVAMNQSQEQSEEIQGIFVVHGFPAILPRMGDNLRLRSAATGTQTAATG